MAALHQPAAESTAATIGDACDVGALATSFRGP